jgi:polysaccharide export outer membrane protein
MQNFIHIGRISAPSLQRWALAMVALLASLSFVTPASAQARLQAYALGPGDVLSITVLKHPEFSSEAVVVATDGRIQVPAIKSIVASRKTIGQVDAEITKELRKRLKNPEVTVSIKQLRPRRVTVAGVVERPAVFDAQPGWRISDAIAAAGGLKVRAELVGGTLTRENGRVINLDVPTILSDNERGTNYVLLPNDRLLFNAKTVQVRVAGQVQRTGAVEVPIGQGVVEAIALAGGASPRAALSKTTINHADGQTTMVDLYSVLVLGNKENNIPVREGDLVLVPEVSGRVTVTGAVAKPGAYDLEDGRTLRISEVVARAGGVATNAAMTKATITRTDGSITPVDVYKVLVQNDQDANIVMQTGDVLTIPIARGVTVLGVVGKPGTYPVEEGAGPRVADLLAAAGGLGVAPDSAQVTISRSLPDGRQQSMEVDLVALIERGDSSQNARIFDGDLINVGTSLRTIYINGVTDASGQTTIKPGVYELKPNDGLPELIAKAGGVSDNAALTKIRVQRGTETINVDAYDALRKGTPLDFKLQAGDNITVPVNQLQVNVMPAVNKPGLVYLPEKENITIAEVLARAGGPLQTAKIKEIALYRIEPGKPLTPRLVSLNPGVRKNGQYDINMLVQPGDYIYVPPIDLKQGGGLQAITSILSPLSILGRLF